MTEYPRRRLHEAEGNDPAAREVITTKWELSKGDLAEIGEVIGNEAMPDQDVTIRRGYDNQIEWDLNIDDSKVIEFIVSNVADLTEDSKQKCLKHPTVT